MIIIATASNAVEMHDMVSKQEGKLEGDVI